MKNHHKTILLALCLAVWMPGCDDTDSDGDGAGGAGGMVEADGGEGGMGGEGGAGGMQAQLPESYPALPEGIVAFAAAVHGDTLIIEGGNRFEAHVGQSSAALNGQRWTLDLLDPSGGWQASEMDWAMQQSSLVSHDGMLYQAGGMYFDNAPDEDVMLFSRPVFRRWDAASEGWVELPPMPGEYGRASHGTAVLDGRLYLSGGWQLTGPSGSGEYLQSVVSIDLDDVDAGWTETAIDFTLRDMCSAGHAGRVWLIGGMTVETMWPATPRVYDPAEGSWSDGPDLPLFAPIKGFGCAATTADGRLYVSTAEGILQLTEDQTGWETIARPEPGRLFSQLVAHEGRLILLGGGTGMTVVPNDAVNVIPLGQ